MGLLELKNIDAGYGRIQILHDVSLEVNEGEVVCVIGPTARENPPPSRSSWASSTIWAVK
mgnify:CR=1 FL=1